jgi:DNA-directed RNA polymerase specialized sigma24 family protein
MTEDSESGEAHGSLSLLLQNWKEHEQGAMERIHEAYLPRLQAFSRKRLAGLPGAATEAEDVVQSAMKSLCLYMRREKPDGPQDRQEIWRLLCCIISRKASRRRGHQARGLPGIRVNPMTDFDSPGNDIPSLLADIRTDEFDVMLSDSLEALDPTLAQVALLLIEGRTHEEIAGRIGCARRTVLRKIDLLKAELSADSSECE